MNAILDEKYNQLKAASDYECWYLVKQPTAFDGLCYLVSILKKYQESDSKANIQEYIKMHVGQLKATNPSIELSDSTPLHYFCRIKTVFLLLSAGGELHNCSDFL